MKTIRLRSLAQTIFACMLLIFASPPVYGATLQDEFDQLCIHIQDAESMSLDKLREIVADCDQLQKKIESSNDEKKKLLLFRLNKCRNFFAYMVELKENGKSGPVQ